MSQIAVSSQIATRLLVKKWVSQIAVLAGDASPPVASADPAGLTWKPLQGSAIQEMAWSDVGAVSLAWPARVRGRVVVESRRSTQKPLSIQARHLNVAPEALARLLEERAAAARALAARKV